MKTLMFPVQLTLRTGLDGPVCTFTSHLPFLCIPVPGHKLILEFNEQVGVPIQDVFHFIPAKENDPACLIVAHPLILDEYDTMLRLLDWFKATYHIEDIRSNLSDPESYYSFYRSVVSVMGLGEDASPKVQYDQVSIKVFAESCRAVAIAELKLSEEELLTGIVGFNDSICALHTMVLEKKKDEKDGADMLLLVKRWERSINPNRSFKWEADRESCLEVARLIFSRLPSIPTERVPAPIRA